MKCPECNSENVRYAPREYVKFGLGEFTLTHRKRYQKSRLMKCQDCGHINSAILFSTVKAVE